jgi:hypothetical protein
MSQVLTTGKPGPPATDHDPSRCSAAAGVGQALPFTGKGDGAPVGPEPLPTPTLDNAPICDVADAPLVGKRRDASGLQHGLHEVRAAGL